MADLEETLDRDTRAMERIADAFEVIADVLTGWVKLEQARFEHEYPVTRVATDIDVFVPPSEEERLLKLISASPEEIEEYVGPRERSFIHPAQSSDRPAAKPRRNKKKVPVKKAEGK